MWLHRNSGNAEMMPQKSFDFGPIYLKKLDCFARTTLSPKDLPIFPLGKGPVGELSSDDQALCFWHPVLWHRIGSGSSMRCLNPAKNRGKR